MVRILLPPSEAKNPGGRGKSLARRGLDAARSTDDLAEPRRQMQLALQRLLDTDAAAAALLLPDSVAREAIADNAAVQLSGTLPALQRYAGVVYDGLDLTSLSPPARRLAARNVLIFSGLFGVLRGNDPVPNYRVPAKASLPGIGIAATFWRRHLDLSMPRLLDSELIIDLRSSDYAAMWQPARTSLVAGRLVAIRVLSPRPDGSLGVISYPSKYFKGRFAAALLECRVGGVISCADELAATWVTAGGKDAVVRTVQSGMALDLITHSAKVVTA